MLLLRDNWLVLKKDQNADADRIRQNILRQQEAFA